MAGKMQNLHNLHEMRQAPSQKDSLLILHPRMVEAGRVRSESALLLERGELKALGDADDLLQRYGSQAQVINAEGWLLHPGLINAHTHVAMGFLRDIAHSQSNMIENLFFFRESRLTPEAVETLAIAGLLAGLKGGATCFVEHYYFSEAIGRAMEKLGVRGLLGETIADFGGAFPGRETFQRARSLVEAWPFTERVRPVVAPHAADTVSEKLFKECIQLSKANDLPIHMHLAQTQSERDFCQKQYQKSPVQWVHELGVLDRQTLAVHLVWATPQDLDLLKKAGTYVGFCPASQMIYDHMAPVKEFFERDLPICLGTDCAASNDHMDVRREAHLMALLAHEHARSQTATLDAWRSVSTHPAEWAGTPQLAGFHVGEKLDCVFVRPGLESLPVQDPSVHLVFSTQSQHVRHVMVDGRWVLWNGQSEFINEESLRNEYLKVCSELKDS